MSVLKDLIQIDSGWGTNDGVETPLFPSIIFSQVKTQTKTQGKYDDKDTFVTGTDIVSFIKTYDINFINQCRTAIDLAVANPGQHPVTFNFPGYIEGARIEFIFKFGHVNTNIHYTYIGLETNIYINEDRVAWYWENSLISEEGANLGKYLEFLTTNKYKVYLAINSNERETYDRSYIIYFNKNIKDYKFQSYTNILSGGYGDPKFTYNTYFWNKPKEAEPDNPIGEQEFSGTNQDSTIGHPELPTVSILNGFHNMYQPDLQVINKVNKGLWTTNFFDNVIKLFNNPIESIVSLTLSPIQPPISDNVTPIIVGNLPMTLTTEGSTEAITSRYLTNQYGTYTFGSMVLYQTYKSFLDYNCSVSIYLPYIGVQKLDIDDVMNSALSLKYNVDFFTGDFVACLQCTKTDGLNSVLYHWKGNILSHIPLSASNFATTYLNGLNTVLSVSQGNTGAIFSNMGSFKPDVSRGGNTSGNVGALDNFEAYIIISKPQESTPDNFKELKGYRSHRKATLSQGDGYIECEEVHVSGTGATDKENEMIEDLLKQGVIL